MHAEYVAVSAMLIFGGYQRPKTRVDQRAMVQAKLPEIFSRMMTGRRSQGVYGSGGATATSAHAEHQVEFSPDTRLSSCLPLRDANGCDATPDRLAQGGVTLILPDDARPAVKRSSANWIGVSARSRH